MAESFDVNIVSVNVGAVSNGVRPMFKVPAAGGAITVIAANVMSNAAGTSAVNLVTLGTAGASANGTIATLGSAVYVAGTPKAFTVATAAVAAGQWVGVEELNVGATNAVTIVDVAYVMGK